MLKILPSLLAVLTLSSAPLFSDASIGEKLETQMWEDMKHRNFAAVEQNIAKEFQSIHTFGALTREAEIDLIKDLNLGSYEITQLKATENDDTIVVTYMIAVREKIENQELSNKPAPRLSVWKKINGKWQWIAHANLKVIPSQPKAPLNKAAKG
jgi:hypothetical protein